jgi:hypothetical protein
MKTRSSLPKTERARDRLKKSMSSMLRERELAATAVAQKMLLPVVGNTAPRDEDVGSAHARCECSSLGLARPKALRSST